MVTDNPRIKRILDPEAKALSAKEAQEDVLLSKHGDERFTATKKWIKHDDAWK